MPNTGATIYEAINDPTVLAMVIVGMETTILLTIALITDLSSLE